MTATSSRAGLSLRKDSPPFDRVLVANRGEIALRIVRACHELGAEAVAVYSDADSRALHVRAADLAVRIGPPPASQSYLLVDAIIEAALSSGAQAVHPGYGFLSEQPELALACASAGLVFVGPGAETLRALGDKLAARAVARAAGVPIVPGTLEPLTVGTAASASELAAVAGEIGYPILVKAAAGGGGRGMRRVDDPAELVDAAASAAREAQAAFGDGAVYLERFVAGGRHVEVQLLGDSQGAIVALGDRDCSVQRRHQKLVEEGPVPGMDAPRRRELHQMAVGVARGVGLRNAATAEFLLAPTGELWFLEVNARLQVEHGVTELVADVDLVHEQLRIAAGEPLSESVLAAAAVAAEPSRHAIEVRLSAEDPARDFAPAPGTVTLWQPPAGPGVRVDAGIEQGSVIGADYDPLLAKVMVVAADRDAAISRLRRALLETEVGGIQTTLPFHRWLVTEPAFADGSGLSTDLVERLWRPSEALSRAALRAAELVAREQLLAGGDGAPLEAPAETPPVWWQRGVEEGAGLP